MREFIPDEPILYFKDGRWVGAKYIRLGEVGNTHVISLGAKPILTFDNLIKKQPPRIFKPAQRVFFLDNGVWKCGTYMYLTPIGRHYVEDAIGKPYFLFNNQVMSYNHTPNNAVNRGTSQIKDAAYFRAKLEAKQQELINKQEEEKRQKQQIEDSLDDADVEKVINQIESLMEFCGSTISVDIIRPGAINKLRQLGFSVVKYHSLWDVSF